MKTKTKSRRRTKQLSEEQRLMEIMSYIALCFMAMTEDGKDEPDYRDIANRTQLSLTTIYRLRSGQISLRMQVRTLQALAYATGFHLEMTATGSRMYVTE